MSRAPAADSPRAADHRAGREGRILSDDRSDASRQSGSGEPGGTSDSTIRTYRGRTVEDLIPSIQEELGADAIILRRREGLTGGLAGFFQRPFVELEAMAGGPRVDLYDEEDAAPVAPFSQERSTPPRSIPPEPQPARMPFYAREPPRSRPDGAYVSEHLAELARAGPLEPTPEPAVEPVSYTQEFHELGRTDPLDPFALELERAESASSSPTAKSMVTSRGAVPTVSPAGETVGHRKLAPSSSRGRAQANIQRKLLGLGVSEQFAEELIDAAAAHILPLAPHTGLTQAVRSALIQRIPLAAPLPTRGAAIALVGPGGAGKTSCCAALLGAYRKSSTLPASCATLVRGPKRGELQMLLSPHVMSPITIENPRAVRALRKTRSEGMLVIDTPPLSPGDRSGIRKLAGLLGELKPERVVIVLPATLGAVAGAQLLQALRPLSANALAVTHADETDQIGVAVEAACGFGLAPEYLLDRGRSGGWRLGRIDPTGLAAKLLQ
jgi:flagellar biosynthesis GTPase FlhF